MKRKKQTQSDSINEMAVHNLQEINGIKNRIREFGVRLNSLNATGEEVDKVKEKETPDDWYRQMMETLEEQNNRIQEVKKILDQIEEFI